MRTSMIVAPDSREIVVDILSGPVSTTDNFPTNLGSQYINSADVPKSNVVFRVIMATESASPGSEAEVDLYDINGVLNGGVPGIVLGSSIDTTTGAAPTPAPIPDPLRLSVYEVDVTTAFAGFAGAGVFEARLISLDNTTLVTATAVYLVFR